jgi:mannosyl-3-phosphoglycerate phosphatase
MPGNAAGRLVLFTDLDDTFLDHRTYSCEVVAPLVSRLRKAAIPIVFCSSKTRAEQEVYRVRLGIEDPFIVEDGCAIWVQQGYFSSPYRYQRTVGGYHVIELSAPYREVRRRLRQIGRETGLSIRGFEDMTAAEVAELTGLDLRSAARARKREYEETLVVQPGTPESDLLLRSIEAAGLRWSRGGRFYSVRADSDKGRATQILAGLFRDKLGRVKTVGIGDSFNDLPMLSVVDVPVLVQRPGGYWEDIGLDNVIRAVGVGPAGWVRVVTELAGL